MLRKFRKKSSSLFIRHKEERLSRKIKNKTNHIEKASVEIENNLTIEESVLLRSVGLDAFVMLRFIRFGFDITFYPFLCMCGIASNVLPKRL